MIDTVIQACARMLHAQAFANLAEEHPAVLKGFNPGPGGDWCNTVPATPAVARQAAEYIWAQVKDHYDPFVATLATRAEQDAFGSDLALHVLGTGAGLYDGDWADDLPDDPDFRYDEGYMYYLEDEAPGPGTAIWAHAKVADPDYDANGKYRGNNWKHVACWRLEEHGGLAPVKETLCQT